MIEAHALSLPERSVRLSALFAFYYNRKPARQLGDGRSKSRGALVV